VACALLAEEVSRSCGIFQDKAYSAALLHDVGAWDYYWPIRWCTTTC
jgi:HD superfamily phosphodiesterase